MYLQVFFPPQYLLYSLFIVAFKNMCSIELREERSDYKELIKFFLRLLFVLQFYLKLSCLRACEDIERGVKFEASVWWIKYWLSVTKKHFNALLSNRPILIVDLT